MIRRLAIPAALALALGACATYDSAYYDRGHNDGYLGSYYSSDGSYRGNGYDDGNYGSYDGDGYYSPGADGYGDYYYDRPQVSYYDYGSAFGYGYGSYGFGYGQSYFPNDWFGLQFGSGYYGGYPYGFYNPWYPGYYYGNHHHHDRDDDRDRGDGVGPPRNGDARREAQRLIDEGGIPGGPARSVNNPRDLRPGIPVSGPGYYGGGLPRDRADYGDSPTRPNADPGERRLRSDQGSPDNGWQQGWRRAPMPRDQGDGRQPVRIDGAGMARGEGMRLSPGMPGVVAPSQVRLQPMPRADYRPAREPIERTEPRREQREAPARGEGPRRSRDADWGGPKR